MSSLILLFSLSLCLQLERATGLKIHEALSPHRKLFDLGIGFLTGLEAKTDFVSENLALSSNDNRLEKDERLGDESRVCTDVQRVIRDCRAGKMT